MDEQHESSHVAFEGDSLGQSARAFEARLPRIVQLVIAHSGGLVTSERQANYVLVVFIIIAFAASLFLFFNDGEKPVLVPSPVGDDPLLSR